MLYHSFFDASFDHYKFIYDEAELLRFHQEILPPLTDEENYFISLSCRKKYATEDQKSKIKGSSEMFERRLVRSREYPMFLRTVRKYEASEGAYTGIDGSNLSPDNMIIYMNFNPCNVMKAYCEFMTETHKNITRLITVSGSSTDYFKRIDRALMTAMHHARGTKHYIDIDFDVNDSYVNTDTISEAMYELCEVLKVNNLKYYVIKTRGGYHLLLKSSTITCDYMSMIKYYVDTNFSNVFKDVMNNSQGMIPLPGCLQAGYPVYVDYELSNF